MKVSVGQKLPNTSLTQMTSDGPRATKISELISGKKTIIVGMPGAFTRTCTTQHLPSLIRNSSAIFNKGIDEIICIVVNDIHVCKAWGEITGATDAGIKIFSDLESEFAKMTGLSFSAPTVGFFNRLQRVLMILNDTEIKHIQLEKHRSECQLTSGETILEVVDKIFDI